jgi:hypothetical protein
VTAATGLAHTIPPDEVIARVLGERARAGVASAERDAKVSRLLVVRVGAPWTQLPAARRLELADEWRHLWRDAVPQGIVAILDAETGKTVVNFDGAGRAHVTPPPAD